MDASVTSRLACLTLRLRPGEDLRQSILAFAKQRNVHAGCVLACVGSLTAYHLRFANQKKGTRKSGHFEILTLTGTFSTTGGHFHVSVANAKGQTTGGHLLDGNIIFTTAEIAIALLPDVEYRRVKDDATGFLELNVTPRKRRKKS